jgi:hypothetical protein
MECPLHNASRIVTQQDVGRRAPAATRSTIPIFVSETSRSTTCGSVASR